MAVRLVVEREREIRAFEKEEYWTLDVDLNAKKPPLLTARLFKKNDETPAISNQESSDALVADLADVDYIVKSVNTREKRRNPVAPFITSTLQQDSSRKLRFSVKRTMMLAQRLYEGVELGKEGAVGLITYMRTDSTRISPEAIAELRGFVDGKYGAQYLPKDANVYKTKKDAQDAHEAIRPTSVLHTPDEVAKYLAEDELKLYRLIWMRFVASQMMPGGIRPDHHRRHGARANPETSYIFRATGSVPKFDGFLSRVSGRQRRAGRRRRGVEAQASRLLRKAKHCA